MTNADTDALVKEARRLREELLKTAARIEAFSDQLTQSVAELRRMDEGETDAAAE